MRNALALMRAAWLSALSYRLATILSFVGLLASVIPLYFIANAVQGIAQESIRLEGGNYFGFVLIGTAAIYVISSAVSAVPGALAGSIGSGTFESLLATRASLPSLLLGLSAYSLFQSLLRAALLVLGGIVLGVEVSWSMLPVVVCIVALTIIAYGAIGLVAASLVLIFRTSGPLLTAVITGTGLLGGVYYSTTVIPGWLQALSGFVPLTYALRAVRRLLLAGASFTDVGADVVILSLIAIGGLALGSLFFAAALRHARRAGTLSQY